MVRSVQRLRARFVASCGLGEFRVTVSGHAIADGGAPPQMRRGFCQLLWIIASSQSRKVRSFPGSPQRPTPRWESLQTESSRVPHCTAMLLEAREKGNEGAHRRKRRGTHGRVCHRSEHAKQRLQLLLRTGLMLGLRRQRDAYPTDACACSH
jgi:hypothetical protein